MEVSIEVDEGPLYEVGSIRVDGISTLPEERVNEAVLLQTGDVASSIAIERTRQAIQDYYLSQGYYRTIVREKLLADPLKPVVDIVYEVREGRLSRVRDVDFSGNVRTHDKVIRREMSIAPGEIFNQVKVRTSTARLRNLNYFSYVNPIITPTNREDEYDVVFQLEEQRTGSFIGGVGVSSIDDLIGFVELSQANFDIFGWPHPTGAGQKVKVRFTLGTSRRDYEVSFIEPWFLDRRLRLSVDAFQHDRRFLSDDYDQRNTGASVGLSKSLATYYTGSVKYALENIEVRNVAEDASELIKIEEGDQIQSSLTFSLQRDTRNKVFVPTAGSRTRAQVKVAGGPLGGDSELYELQLKNASFIPLWFDHVLSLRGVISVVEPYGDGDRVPIFDRLFQGGARTIRGFDFRDVGPRDEFGEPIGGQSEFQYTVEYSIPITDQFRFATFYDGGNVWVDGYDWDFGDLNSSYGIGLRIDIPGFPLQLDYSWPIEADEFNDRSGGRFSFLIGYFY